MSTERVSRHRVTLGGGGVAGEGGRRETGQRGREGGKGGKEGGKECREGKTEGKEGGGKEGREGGKEGREGNETPGFRAKARVTGRNVTSNLIMKEGENSCKKS